MPVQAHTEDKPKEDGTVSPTLHVEFSNGSLQQLRELGAFFGVASNDPSEVVKLAISFLQNIKDRSSKSEQGTAKKKD